MLIALLSLFFQMNWYKIYKCIIFSISRNGWRDFNPNRVVTPCSSCRSALINVRIGWHNSYEKIFRKLWELSTQLFSQLKNSRILTCSARLVNISKHGAVLADYIRGQVRELSLQIIVRTGSLNLGGCYVFLTYWSCSIQIWVCSIDTCYNSWRNSWEFVS